MDSFVSQLSIIRKQKIKEYEDYFASNMDNKVLAAQKIKKFYSKIIKKSFNDGSAIKGIYRCRINFTLNHLSNHSNKLNYCFNKYLFTWCFDINKLIKIYKCRLFICGCVFNLLPDDHLYVEKIWNLVNGKTRQSIIYLSNMDYWKSCSIDSHL